MNDTSKAFPEDYVNYYCDINLNSVCRVCLEKNQPHKKPCNIFQARLDSTSDEVSNMIMACASVQVLLFILRRPIYLCLHFRLYKVMVYQILFAISA